MLDHVMSRAPRRRWRSSTRTAPTTRAAVEDWTFDVVYLVTALGEIPEPDRVLAAAAERPNLVDGRRWASSSTGIGFRSADCTAWPTPRGRTLRPAAARVWPIRPTPRAAA